MNRHVLLAVRQRILDDPEFHMGSWDRCIAGQICRVSGRAIKTLRFRQECTTPQYVVEIGGELVPVDRAAHWVLGVPYPDVKLQRAFLFVRGCERALEMIDWLLQQVGPEPTTEQVEEILDHLVEV